MMASGGDVIDLVPAPVAMGTGDESRPSASWGAAKLLQSEFASADDCDECKRMGKERLPVFVEEGIYRYTFSIYPLPDSSSRESICILQQIRGFGQSLDLMSLAVHLLRNGNQI